MEQSPKQPTQPKKVQQVEVRTHTKVSTWVGLGMVGLSGVAGLFFFTQFAKLFSEESPAPAVTTTTITLREQTKDLLKQKTATPSAIKLAKDRQASLLKKINSDPAAALQEMLPQSAVEQLPIELQAYAEHEQSLSGTLRVRIKENGESHEETIEHQLTTTDGKAYTLHVAGGPQNFQTGQKVSIKTGFVLGEQVVAADMPDGTDTGADNIVPTAPVTQVATTTKKVAVFLFNFANDARQTMTVDQAKAAMFSNTNSIANYYQEVSYNQLGLTGDVFGWYTIPSTAPTTGAGCDSMDTWAAQAKTAAQNAGVNISGYDYYQYAFPMVYPAGSTEFFKVCAWAGISDIGGNQSWVQGIPNYFNIRVSGHELGHNFGFYHAQASRCLNAMGQSVAIGNFCTTKNYGDNFDIMGNNPAANRHFNAYRKGQKWLTATNTLDVNTSGTYTLAPLEQTTTSPQIIRIPRLIDASGKPYQYYYLEYRQPFGTFDNFSTADPMVNGVIFHLAPAYTTSNVSYLLDATPETADTSSTDVSGFNDAALGVGKTFADVDTGLAVTVTGVTPAGATLNITKSTATCNQGQLSATVPSVPRSYPGVVSGQLISGLNNSDSLGCGNTTFRMTGTLPAGWTQSATNDVSIAPGTSGYYYYTITPASTATAGQYPITETFTSTTDASRSFSSTYYYTVLDAESVAPTVAITSPANNTNISSASKVNIAATASDASGIAKIDLKIDGATVKTCSGATSCTYSWTLRKESSGSHTITAVATDKSPRANQSIATITVVK